MADAMIPFVDGTAVPATNISANLFTTTLSAGSHTVAIFTSHYGRNKLYAYIGPVSQMDLKGLTGTASLLGPLLSGPTSLTSWKVMMTNSAAVGSSPPATNAPGWANYTVGTDAFGGQPGYAWLQTRLPSVSAAGVEIANFSSVDDNGWIYLNGTLLTTNHGWNVPFESSLTSAWNVSGPNVLTVLIQNTGGAGGLDSGVTFSAYQSQSTLNSWVQQGGPGNPNATTGWQTLPGGETFSGPQFFKSTFTASPFGTTGTDPMWRVTTSGLSHGSVWVNGYNLGRYPEKISAPGVYIPECWLNAGANANTLVIYDESGNLPTQVQAQPETAASRDVVIFQSAQPVTISAPPAPAGLVAVASGTQVSLAWNAAPGAISYKVKRSAINGGAYAVIAMGVTATNYTDTGLATATTYYYVVSAVDAGNESTNSVQVSATAALAGPAGLTATEVSSSQVNLTWNALTNAASYNVKRSTISGGPYATIATGVTTTNYTDTGVSVSAGCFYVVGAMVGGAETANSTEAALSYPELTGAIIGTPGSWNNDGNTITNVFDNNLTTFFDAPTGNGDWVGLDFGVGVSNVITQLNYCPRSGYAARMVGGIFEGANQTNFSDAVTLYTVTTQPATGGFTSVSVTNTTAFRYVRYLSPNGGFGNVAELQFYGYSWFLASASVSPPSPPVGLVAAVVSSSQINLTWNAASNAASYNVKRSTINGGSYTVIAGGVTATNYSDTGLAGGTIYYYVVSGVNTNGESLNSTQAPATTVSGSSGTLIHEYSFSETNGSTTTADSIGGPIWNGVLPNGGTFSNGVLTLSPASSLYAILPAGIVSSLSNITLMAWVNLNSNTNINTRVFDFGNDTTTYMYLTPLWSSETLRFTITTNSVGGEQPINCPNTVSTGAWHQVAVTLNGQIGILYLDGVPVGTNSSLTLNPSSMGVTTNNYLGKSQWPEPYLDGSLDEVRIYNTGLAAAEIAATAALGSRQQLNPNSPQMSALMTGTNLTLVWPLAAAGYTLQSSTNLVSANWGNVTSPVPQIVGGQWLVAIPSSNAAGATFYRLVKRPVQHSSLEPK